MRSDRASQAQRRQIAQAALDELGASRSEWLRLEVLCAASHRVAAVYDTSAGWVYASVIGPHSHGSRDFVGARQPGRQYADLLRADALVDDVLPAWCGCGPRSLSRAELAAAIREHRRHLHVT
jgi:hypothetical protein